MSHVWIYGGTVDDGGERVRVRRCEGCGATERMPLATAPCPMGADENARAKESFIAKHGREAWYARHYAARARYEARKAAAKEMTR